MITIKHSGNIGDIIYSLPAMRKAARLNSTTVDLKLLIDQPGQLAPGHPLGNVMLNRKIAELSIPLFESLGFINSVDIITETQDVDYDFDKFRTIGLKYTGHISRWYFYTYPELTCDLSEPILIPYLREVEHYDIVINRTTRYHGDGWDYLMFREFQSRMTFVGLESEYNILKAKLPEMKYRPVKDFLELAGIIKYSTLFIGNQSMAFALAEIMKVPRALEVCQNANNVIPTGVNGFDCHRPSNLIHILRNNVFSELKPEQV